MVTLYIDEPAEKRYSLLRCLTIGNLNTENTEGIDVMYTSDIFLPSIEAVKKFVTLTNQCSFPVNLATDKYKIDAKSIMGIFSLDLSKPLRLAVDDQTADKESLNTFISQIGQFQATKASEKN